MVLHLTEKPLANTAFMHGTRDDPSAMLTTLRYNPSLPHLLHFQDIKFDKGWSYIDTYVADDRESVAIISRSPTK